VKTVLTSNPTSLINTYSVPYSIRVYNIRGTIRLVLVGDFTDHQRIGTNRRSDVAARVALSGIDRMDPVGIDHTVLIGGWYRP
jgi:hypothetical protein